MLPIDQGFRAAPTSVRLIAGLADLAVEAAVGAAIAWWWVPAEEWPPRYWNLMDYAVDMVWQRPDLLERVFLSLGMVFLVWETFWGRLVGNAPIARLLGMRIVTTRGRRPGILRLVLRAVFRLAGTALGFAGPLVAIIHPGRRMLHDMLTGCHVLIGTAPPEADAPGDDANGLILEGECYRDGPYR